MRQGRFDSSDRQILPTTLRKPPDLLYHYTTAAGLLGILETSELWASHARFLNDPTEVAFAAQRVTAALEAKMAERGAEPAVGLFDLGKKVLEITKLFTGRSALGVLEAVGGYYVTCFCEESDLLSQWRGYASGVGGFALGFRASALVSDGVQLIKVVYDQEEQQRRIDEVVDRMGEAGAGPALDDMLKLHVTLKNPAFAEEDEWRLVTFRTDYSDVRVRPAGELLVPYVPLRSARVDRAASRDDKTSTAAASGQVSGSESADRAEAAPRRNDDPTPDDEARSDDSSTPTSSDATAEGNISILPLEEIVIGPTPNAALVETAVRIALANNGYSWSMNIVHSEVPLRHA